MFKLNLHCDGTDANKRYLSVPTSIDEIKIDYLKALTADVKVPKFHALVAYIVRGSLLDRFTKVKQKDTIAGAFMLVKANDPDDACVAVPGEMLIASAQDIMMGYEVPVPQNAFSERRVFIECAKAEKHDTSVLKKVNGNPYTNIASDASKTIIYTVGFKIVPLVNIHGAYDKNVTIDKNVSEQYYSNE